MIGRHWVPVTHLFLNWLKAQNLVFAPTQSVKLIIVFKIHYTVESMHFFPPHFLILQTKCHCQPNWRRSSSHSWRHLIQSVKIVKFNKFNHFSGKQFLFGQSTFGKCFPNFILENCPERTLPPCKSVEAIESRVGSMWVLFTKDGKMVCLWSTINFYELFLG